NALAAPIHAHRFCPAICAGEEWRATCQVRWQPARAELRVLFASCKQNGNLSRHGCGRSRAVRLSSRLFAVAVLLPWYSHLRQSIVSIEKSNGGVSMVGAKQMMPPGTACLQQLLSTCMSLMISLSCSDFNQYVIRSENCGA